MYCPDSYNWHFKKSFLPWFLADVLSEDTIIKWYKGGYSQKGKTVFLEQMKKMVEWLQSAEEGIWQLHVGIVFQPDHVFLPPFTSPPLPSWKYNTLRNVCWQEVCNSGSSTDWRGARLQTNFFPIHFESSLGKRNTHPAVLIMIAYLHSMTGASSDNPFSS